MFYIRSSETSIQANELFKNINITDKTGHLSGLKRD